MTSHRIHARSVEGGGGTIDAAERVLPVDVAWDAAPTGDPGPADLLASAFAACLLKGLARAGAMMPFRYESAEVEVTLTRDDLPPRFRRIEYDLRVVSDEDERRADLLHRNLRQFGTVYNTLAAACEVEGTLTLVDPAA
jgi:uncharacterized OsmC-like protein